MLDGTDEWMAKHGDDLVSGGCATNSRRWSDA